jgi:hypothetical protein
MVSGVLSVVPYRGDTYVPEETTTVTGSIGSSWTVRGQVVASRDASWSVQADPNFLVHYDFSGSGTTVPDMSGNGYDGTASNSGIQVSGSALIDATGERVVRDASSISALRPSAAATITAKVRVSAGGGGQGYPIHMARLYDSTTFGLWISRASGVVAISAVVRAAGAVNVLSVPSEHRPAENTDAHLALVYDGTAGRIYVNGVERASAGNSGNLVYGAAEFQSWQIGDHQHMPAGMTGYTVDNVRIYGRALSAGEIAALAAG